MSYYIDLNNISLNEYKNMLKTRYLIPSQIVLRKNIDKYFLSIEKAGFKNMAMLKETFKTKKKAEDFAKTLNLPIDYTIVLRRELMSHHPPARKIAEYPTISDSIKSKLDAIDIKTSRQLYDLILTKKNRLELSKKLNASDEEILAIAKLMDVTRLRYVSPLFATLLVHSSCDSVEKLSKADEHVLYDEVKKINENNKFFKGNIGKNDMKFLIQDTEYVSIDIVDS